jgi:hypothetical protein
MNVASRVRLGRGEFWRFVHLHFQPRKKLHILLRHAQFQQHDPIYTLAQVFGDRRPGFGRRLAGRPEVQLEVFDFMIVVGGFGEELALDSIVLVWIWSETGFVWSGFGAIVFGCE